MWFYIQHNLIISNFLLVSIFCAMLSQLSRLMSNVIVFPPQAPEPAAGTVSAAAENLTQQWTPWQHGHYFSLSVPRFSCQVNIGTVNISVVPTHPLPTGEDRCHGDRFDPTRLPRLSEAFNPTFSPASICLGFNGGGVHGWRVGMPGLLFHKWPVVSSEGWYLLDLSRIRVQNSDSL